MPRDRVFVSYSHKDTEWLAQLKAVLKPDIRNDRIDYFDDFNIRPGEDWYNKITAAIDQAKATVLLISPNFFASDFIRTIELPRILTAAHRGELTILWVPLFGVLRGPDAPPGAALLDPWQAFLDPARPLAALTDDERTDHLLRLCHEIGETFGPNPFVPRNLPFASLGNLFVGRERELSELRGNLSRSGAAAITPTYAAQAVSGLGGIGKTRLAVEYAWRHQDAHTAFLFVRAATETELRSGLSALCRPEALDLADDISEKEDQRYAAVLRWLNTHRDWLLILDNVDTPEAARAVESLVAKLEGGQILITSRIAEWSRSVAQSRVGLLEPAAARELLLQRSGVADTEEMRAEADTLAAKLGCLPLALEIAAAYVAQQAQGFGLRGYLWLYEKAEFDLLNVPPVEAYPRSVFVTWRESVARLEEGARKILEMHSFMAPTPCPLAMHFAEVDEVAVRSWAADLFRYSLAEKRPEDMLSVHPLLQTVERHELKSRGEDTPTMEAVAMLLAAFAGKPSWKPESRKLWDVMLPHAEALQGHMLDRAMDLRTGILWRIGDAYQKRGDYNNAIAPYHECLAIEERVLGFEHHDTLESANNLASLFESHGEYAAAETLYRRVLAVHVRVAGVEDRATLTSMNNLAGVLDSKGDYAGAEPLFRRALEAGQRVLGPEHSDTLIWANNLGRLLQSRGNYAEAEPLLRRVLEVRERKFPEEPETISSLNNLAALLESKGEHAAALPLCRRALEASERVLGPEHPDTLASVNNLASVLESQNDYSAAEPLYRRALEALERTLGPQHPATLSAANNLGYLLSRKGDYSSAEPLFRRAVEGWGMQLGPDHPDTLGSVRNLARLLQDKGDHAAAEALTHRLRAASAARPGMTIYSLIPFLLVFTLAAFGLGYGLDRLFHTGFLRWTFLALIVIGLRASLRRVSR